MPYIYIQPIKIRLTIEWERSLNIEHKNQYYIIILVVVFDIIFHVIFVIILYKP